MTESLIETRPVDTGGGSERQFARANRSKKRIRAVQTTVVSFGTLILIWWMAAAASGVPAIFFPAPSDVFAAFFETFQRGLLAEYAAVSIGRWTLGVVIGLVAAIVVAVILSLSTFLAKMFFPIINFFHAIVEIAWLPIFVLWFGYGLTTITVCIAYVVFFPVLYNTLLGLRSVPQNMINASLTLGANRWQLSREVLLPGAMPGIITGLRLGAGYGWRALVAAEILAAQSGLGFFIFDSRNALLTPRIFVGMIIIGLIWMVVDFGYLRPLERATVQRWGMMRSEQ